MKKDNEELHIGIRSNSFSTLLTIVFIVLKLCKVITWSWVWVLSPLWIGWLIALLLIIIVLIIKKGNE